MGALWYALAISSHSGLFTILDKHIKRPFFLRKRREAFGKDIGCIAHRKLEDKRAMTRTSDWLSRTTQSEILSSPKYRSTILNTICRCNTESLLLQSPWLTILIWHAAQSVLESQNEFLTADDCASHRAIPAALHPLSPTACGSPLTGSPRKYYMLQ
jgi:hypothetical protein